MATLTYRSDNESALTYNEMDDNFRYFKENPETSSLTTDSFIKIDFKDGDYTSGGAEEKFALLPVGSIAGFNNYNPITGIGDSTGVMGFKYYVKTHDSSSSLGVRWEPIGSGVAAAPPGSTIFDGGDASSVFLPSDLSLDNGNAATVYSATDITIESGGAT